MEKKKILIIDDDYATRELIESMFIDEESYEILKAENAMHGWELLMENPQLAIVDIMMPGLDGYEFCRKVRNISHIKNVPLMVLTAKHQESDLKEAIHAGVDEFITKPFDVDILKKRIEVYAQGLEEIPEESQTFKYQGTLHFIRGKKDKI